MKKRLILVGALWLWIFSLKAQAGKDYRLLDLFNDDHADLIFQAKLNEPGFLATRTWTATAGEAYIAACFVTQSPTDKYTLIPAKIEKVFDGHPMPTSTWLAGAEHVNVIWHHVSFNFFVPPPSHGKTFVPVYCMVKRGVRNPFEDQ